MDYDKVKTLEAYDLSRIEGRDDYERRLGLIKGYLGQINYINAKRIPRETRRRDTNRRTKRDPQLQIYHFEAVCKAWEERIERVLSGEPLENFVGKSLKVDVPSPPSKRKKPVKKKKAPPAPKHKENN